VSSQRLEGEAQDPFDPTSPDGQWYRNDLHRFLVSRLANREDVRDLAQEAYLRYIQADVSTIRSPRDYLFRLAGTLISEWILLRDRSPVTCDSRLADLRSTHLADSSADACEQLSTQEQLEHVLEQIPLVYRRVLILSRCHGLSYEEIAEELGLKRETVHKYIVRATAFARRAQWK
jgi:RNA polymerase sigma factor (sigma-70 family)